MANVGHAATLSEKVSDKSFGKSSDLLKAFSKLGTIAAVGSTIIDILETGDVTKELSGLAGSALTGAALGAGMGALTGNPLIIGAAAIAGGIAGEKGVEAAIDWLRKSDAAKIEDIDSVIEWIKKPNRYQDDPNFSPPEELDKGGAPAAVGSSRAPGQRGSINPVDAHNALDSLAAENALYDGSLFRHVNDKERARLKDNNSATGSNDIETPSDAGTKETGRPSDTSPERGAQKPVEQELPQGGTPAATGSSRPLGRRGSIKAGDEYNALDALAEENARSGGSLFRGAINKHLEQQKQQEQENTPQADREISESARQQREQAPHASGESQQDSTGRRSRGPYDLDGPEAAAQKAPAAEAKAGSNSDSDAQTTTTQEQYGTGAHVENGAEDGTDQPLSYYDTQYGPHGNRARAYIHYMEEKERAQQAEENERRAAERAERALRNIPRQVPVNATGRVGGVSRSPAWKEGIVAPYEAFERPYYPNRDNLKPTTKPYYPGRGPGDVQQKPFPYYPGRDPGDAVALLPRYPDKDTSSEAVPLPYYPDRDTSQATPMPYYPDQHNGETWPPRTRPPNVQLPSAQPPSAQPPSAQAVSTQPSSTWPPPYIDNFILGGPSFGLDARGLSLISRILQQYGRPSKAAGPFPSANEFLKGPPRRTMPTRPISAETDEDDFETGSYGGPTLATIVGAQLMNEK